MGTFTNCKHWYCWWDKNVYNLVIAFQLLSQCATLLPFHHQAANLIFLNCSFGFVIWGAVWSGNFCLLSLHFNHRIVLIFCFKLLKESTLHIFDDWCTYCTEKMYKGYLLYFYNIYKCIVLQEGSSNLYWMAFQRDLICRIVAPW